MGLVSYVVKTSSSTGSLFVGMSREVSSPLLLHVNSLGNSLYLVTVYTHELIPLSVIKEFYGRSEKSRIVSMSRYVSENLSILTVVKERCEFLELAKGYNVVIQSPYIVHRGSRIYCITGYREPVDKYIDNLQSYYGRRNVIVKRGNPARCLEDIVKIAIRNFLFSKLTPRELYILSRAYEEAYISARRGVRLSNLAKRLGLSKPTTSIMLRKALGKLLKDLFEDLH
jgi:predicted DNA binding protein